MFLPPLAQGVGIQLMSSSNKTKQAADFDPTDLERIRVHLTGQGMMLPPIYYHRTVVGVTLHAWAQALEAGESVNVRGLKAQIDARKHKDTQIVSHSVNVLSAEALAYADTIYTYLVEFPSLKNVTIKNRFGVSPNRRLIIYLAAKRYAAKLPPAVL